MTQAFGSCLRTLDAGPGHHTLNHPPGGRPVHGPEGFGTGLLATPQPAQIEYQVKQLDHRLIDGDRAILGHFLVALVIEAAFFQGAENDGAVVYLDAVGEQLQGLGDPAAGVALDEVHNPSRHHRAQATLSPEADLGLTAPSSAQTAPVPFAPDDEQ